MNFQTITLTKAVNYFTIAVNTKMTGYAIGEFFCLNSGFNDREING
ncbi:hypothetical protein LPICM02_340006 [Pseudolactococcus piscium]|nr:hypothetical protein LPICM02_340006 [Lactococcus piscium]